jgi:hypothetical protein
LAYFNVFKVSSAFESAGLTQAAATNDNNHKWKNSQWHQVNNLQFNKAFAKCLFQGSNDSPIMTVLLFPPSESWKSKNLAQCQITTPIGRENAGWEKPEISTPMKM